LGDGNYRRFLQEYSQQPSQSGPILTSSGQALGQHEGLPFYTIGQRKGLGVSASEPLFVLRKDVARNALIVGPKSELGQQMLIARDVNWLSGQPPTEPIEAQIKIRYKAKEMAGTVVDLGNGRCQVTFLEPVFGVTAGQGAIFYEGDVCLGGGIIADGTHVGNQTATSTDSAQAVAAPITPSLQLAHIQVLS
jgi:tRNA-specific 2-thiouridylase